MAAIIWAALVLGIRFVLTPQCLAFSFITPTVPTVNQLQTDATKNNQGTHETSRKATNQLKLSGDWATAKQSLRNPSCCVVSVQGLSEHLFTLQHYFCGERAPSDLDLRMRVRCVKDENDCFQFAYDDCTKIYNAIMNPASMKHTVNLSKNHDNQRGEDNDQNNHPCILALEELAKGVASLADGPLEGTCTDVHMRVVCASSYQAIDPMFHTDKCPLRGYVTLTGPGTEYMEQTCLPWEYVALRSFGVDGLSAVSGGKEGKAKSLKMADELTFIVMKGDYYEAPLQENLSPSVAETMIGKVWDRSSACVHRSPPGEEKGERRVILSLDLADGLDDQEWYEISRKRGWRSGMTQRKSRLVS